MVVADRSVAAEQRFQDLLAIGGVFQREAEIGIVVGRLVDLHRRLDVITAGRANELQARFFEQADRLVIDAVDDVDLPGLQRIEARRGIGDHGDFRRVEMAAALFQ